ncbi:MAG: adenylate/guanylate cyclase domain-containing protein [Phycisphaerae bacterium]
MVKRQLRTKLTGILLGLFGTLVASLGFYSGVYERLERLTLDWRFRLPYYKTGIKDSGQLCIIGIDDGSLASVGDWPWPRTHIAKIINLLNELESREILVDLVFSMPKSTDKTTDNEKVGEDDLLAQACREQGKVILSSYFAPSREGAEIVNLLVSNFKLTPEGLAKKTNLTVNACRSNFVSLRRRAARKLVMDLLARQPKLSQDEVVIKTLGRNWMAYSDQKRELERAYDYIQAYLQVRAKAGWMIEEKDLPPPIRLIGDNTQMIVPISKLSASCCDVGFVNFDPDADGKVREISLLKSYENMIYRQLALAGACQYLKIDPDNFRIGAAGIDLVGKFAEIPEKKDVILRSPEKSGIHIPVTRNGNMILNWYAPKSNRWEESFSNIIPASRLLEIVFNQESLQKNRRIFTDAMPMTVKRCLPDQYEQYIKLIKRLPLLQESVDNISEDSPTTAPSTTMPTTTSAPATTLEDDLRTTWEKTKAEVDKIESDALEQLDWLYSQLSQLPANEQSREDNQQIRTLWRCLNHPEEVRKINADLELALNQKIEEITPLVREKIALIGYTATTLTDFVPTPVFDRCPGLLVHANILNQILQKSFLSESERNSDLLVILVIGTVVSILSAQRSAFEGLLWMLLLLAGFSFFTCYVVFGKLHIVSSLVGPAGAIVLSWSLVSFYRQLTERRAKQIFAGRLSQYTNPALARKIAEHPEGLEILPEQREVTCYFSDLAGFTPLAEKLGPEQTVAFLNIYLEHMTEVLDRQEAFVNKFQADGIFAFFNPPLHNQDDHARRACLAAVESQIALPHIQEHLADRFPSLTEPLRMRVGISTGQAVVGDCGSTRKFDYTCLGDTVNLASRMESANKFFGTGIMICDRTSREMGDDFLVRLLGKIRVVGREQSVVVYELIGYRKDHEDLIEFAELFDQMVLGYWQGEFDKVGTMLDRLEQLKSGDRSIKVYRGRLERIGKTDRQHFQDGVIDIGTK